MRYAVLVRLVPIRGGKPYRFGFENLWLDAHAHKDVPDMPLLQSGQARFEATGSQVTVRPKKGYVAVNGGQIHDVTPLAHGDIIAVSADRQGMEFAWEFEGDLRLAKATRLQAEAGRGLHRVPPDTLVFDGRDSSNKHDWQVAIDPQGITVAEKGHRLFRSGRSESFPWDELDAVDFTASGQTKYVQTSSDVLREVAVGVKVGLRMAEEALEARLRDDAASETERVFLAPAYQVRLLRNGKDLGERVNLERGRCALLAQAIEYFAPIDLLWIPSFPETVPLSAGV
jgi:hypothetical protein